MSLAAWQDDFAAALRGAPSSLAAHPAFAVYRNTVWKGWIDALMQNFPAVTRLAGGDWMAMACAAYAQTHPPAHPMLSRYGDDFPEFMDAFPPAREWRFLADIARIDRAWTHAHLAADDDPLRAADLAALPPDTLASTHLPLRASARLLSFPATVPGLWLANRADFDGGEHALEDRAQAILVWRAGETVEARLVDPAELPFLDACRLGRSIADASGAALLAAPQADLSALIVNLLSAEVFAGLAPLSEPPP